ncbi:putative multidrug resistance transporter, Bcr/CflA family protein [Micromonospora sonchi]|uniref:Multidrug resistance transporter, Bcr/CflA family protein n=2 Tax=Micromonospora sonchi TaxID=1763543 RepID=A0A917TJI1_9ACTN|nr:putative multidrug resistance transporter, Bcr/CflA family protein [Micromonospora sonchi]
MTAVDTAVAPPNALMPGDLMSRRQRLRLILVLGSLIALGPLTIDMYLPALPAIADDLATSSSTVQLTLTGTLVGLALGQLVIGPFSDALGRRRPLIAGTALHIVASLGCALAPNIAVLGALRVVQGLGAAAAAVIAMAVVRDLFSGSSFAQLLSRLLLVMSAAPILAPTLGSELLRWTQWRGIFVALMVFGGLLMLVATFGLSETLPPGRRQRGGVLSTARLYRSLLRDRAFVGLVLVAALAMAAIFAYVAGSSFVMQEQYGLSEQQFGFAFGAGAIGLIAATQGNVRLLRRYSPQQILTAALLIGSAAALVLLGVAATGFGGLPALLGSLWLALTAIALAMPNAPALALSRHGEAAGTASALLGAVQFGVGAVTAPLVGVLGNGAVAMALLIAGGLVMALVVLLLVVRPARLTPTGPEPAVVVVH